MPPLPAGVQGTGPPAGVQGAGPPASQPQPDVPQPEVPQPGVLQPDVLQPDVPQSRCLTVQASYSPGVLQSGVLQPGVLQSGVPQVGVLQPDVLQSDVLILYGGAAICRKLNVQTRPKLIIENPAADLDNLSDVVPGQVVRISARWESWGAEIASTTLNVAVKRVLGCPSVNAFRYLCINPTGPEIYIDRQRKSRGGPGFASLVRKERAPPMAQFIQWAAPSSAPMGLSLPRAASPQVHPSHAADNGMCASMGTSMLEYGALPAHAQGGAQLSLDHSSEHGVMIEELD